MARGTISKRAVDALEPGDKDRYLWDSELAGFGLKVTPAGNRVYLVQYRVGGRRGRTRRVTIGRHGTPGPDGSPWTPDRARKRAKALLGAVADNRDPAAERGVGPDVTIQELCDLYLEEGCATKKASTKATDRSNIERHIKPLLGRRQVRELQREHVERFLRDVAEGKSRADMASKKKRGRVRVRGGKGTASRSVAVLSAILSFAVQRRVRPDNPARGVRLYQGRKRERFLSDNEFARLGQALEAAEAAGENSSALAAIRLLMFTGARKSEILTLKWEFIDWQRSCLRLPDSKTGAKVVPLGRPAMELLAALPKVGENPYVLPGAGAGHFVGLQKAWAVIRKRAELEDVRLHDLRHSFASVAIAGGSSLYLAGKVLGHKQSRTTEIYAHLDDDPLRAVADRTATAIAAAVAPARTKGAV